MQGFVLLEFLLVRAIARSILWPFLMLGGFGEQLVRRKRTVTYATMTHPFDALPIDVMLPYQVENLGGKARLVVHLIHNRGSATLGKSHRELVERHDQRVANLGEYVDEVLSLAIGNNGLGKAAEYAAGLQLARAKCATSYCLWIDPDMFVVAPKPAVWLQRSIRLLEGSISAAPWPFVGPHYLGSPNCLNRTYFSSQLFLWKAGRDSLLRTPLGNDTFEAAVNEALKREAHPAVSESEEACDLGLRVVHPPDNRRSLVAMLRTCGDESGGEDPLSFRRGLSTLQQRLVEGSVRLEVGGFLLRGDAVCTTPTLSQVGYQGNATELPKHKAKRALAVQVYTDRSGHDSRNPKLYCYVFLRSPLPPVTALLGHQLNQSCDDWDLFGSESNRDLL